MVSDKVSVLPQLHPPAIEKGKDYLMKIPTYNSMFIYNLSVASFERLLPRNLKLPELHYSHTFVELWVDYLHY